MIAYCDCRSVYSGSGYNRGPSTGYRPNAYSQPFRYPYSSTRPGGWSNSNANSWRRPSSTQPRPYGVPLSGLPPRSSNYPVVGNYFEQWYYQIRDQTAARAERENSAGRSSWPYRSSRPSYLSVAADSGRVANYVNSDRVANIATRRLYDRLWIYH